MFTSLYLFGGWLIRLVMIPVVARRHRPFVALSWLAPVFLFPVIGTLLYLWLSVYGLKRSADGHREVREKVERDDWLREQRRHRVQPMFGPDQRRLVRLGEQLSTRRFGGFPILGGNTVELFDRPGQTVDRLIEDIDAAERHAHLLFYQFMNDATGRRVGEALMRAAGRGVQCRVLVDAWASRQMRRSLGREMRRHGVEVKPTLPLHPLRQPLARVDVRNHRKIAVIDGRTGYTGSTNIHDPDHALDDGIWHQISIRERGPAVLQLQMLFVEDWYFATDQMLAGPDVFPEAERPGEVPIMTIPDGPSYQTNILQHLLVQALDQAEARLTLTTPYLIPEEATLLALRLAALRGAEVDIVIPEQSDRSLADHAARAYFPQLVQAGVRIHLHPSGILHAKTISVDDRFALIGTANFDRRSLFLNYELMQVVFDDAFTRRLRESQQRYIDESSRVTQEQVERRSEAMRTVDSVAALLSPVL